MASREEILDELFQRGVVAPPAPTPVVAPETDERRQVLDELMDPTIKSTSPTPLIEGFQIDKAAQQTGLEARTDDPLAPPPDPSIGDRIWQRVTGEDVEDPLELTRLGSIFAGAVEGGFIGSRTPPLNIFVNPATGAFAGSIFGAVVGAAAPEGFMEAGELAGFLEPGTRDREGLSDENLKTVLLGEALLEGATGGTIGLARLAGRSIARSAADIGRAASDFATEVKQVFDIDMTPIMLFEREGYKKVVTQVVGRFPLISTVFTRAGEKFAKEMENALGTLAARLGPVLKMPKRGARIFLTARNYFLETHRVFSEKYGKLFAQADELGAFVVPGHTRRVGQDLIAWINGMSPRVLKKIEIDGKPLNVVVPNPDAIMSNVVDFITENVTNLAQRQSLRQMKEFTKSVNRFLLGLEPGQRKFAASLVQDLMTAAKLDIRTNISGPAIFGKRLLELDDQFTKFMDMFETTTAKKVGRGRKRGVKGMTFEPATGTPVARLFKSVIDFENPEAITELWKMTGKDVQLMKEIAAGVVQDAVEKSTSRTNISATRDLVTFDVKAFKRSLGLDLPSSGRFEVVTELMKRAGGLDPKDLDLLIKALELGGSVGADGSVTFIARRLALGGAGGVFNIIIPVAAGGRATPARSVGRLLAGYWFVVRPIRAFAETLVDSRHAKLLTVALSESSGLLQRRAAALRLVVFGLRAADDLSPVEKQVIISEFTSALDKALTLAVEGVDKVVEGAKEVGKFAKEAVTP